MTEEQLKAEAEKIVRKAVELKAGPFGDLARMCISRSDKSELMTGVMRRFINEEEGTMKQPYWDLIMSARNDDILNIAPICVLLGSDTEQCKSSIGKGVWKKLSSNDFKTNSAIFYVASKNEICEKDKIEVIKRCADFSQEVILVCFREAFNKSNCATSVPKSLLEKASKIEDEEKMTSFVGIFYDTMTMAGRLDRPFNENWSIKRMEDEHHAMSLELACHDLGIPKDKIFNIAVYGERILESIDIPSNLSVKVLKNVEDFQAEARSMEHCIAMHCQGSCDGDKLIFHIEENEGRKERTTLGINHRFSGDVSGLNVGKGVGTFTRFEHKGPRNASVVSRDIIAISEKIVQKLNSTKVKSI